MRQSEQRPNILFIMVDQLVAALTGAYGHPVVQTPNLDRLARAGVRFDVAHSPCPLCAPARAALLTGRYVSRIGVDLETLVQPAKEWPLQRTNVLPPVSLVTREVPRSAGTGPFSLRSSADRWLTG